MSTTVAYPQNILNWNTKEFPNNEYSLAAKSDSNCMQKHALHKPVNHMNNSSSEYDDMVKSTADFMYNKMLKEIDTDNILNTLKESIRKEMIRMETEEKRRKEGKEREGREEEKKNAMWRIVLIIWTYIIL